MLLLIYFMVTMNSAYADTAPAIKLKTNVINEKSVVAGLPLTFAEKGKSNNNRLRNRWKITDSRLDKDLGWTVEFIGQKMADADKVQWRCAEYDVAGNLASAVPEINACHQLLVKMLGKFVADPAPLAAYLIKTSEVRKQSFGV